MVCPCMQRELFRTAVMMPVFPTLDTIQQVLELGESRLPIQDKNELLSLLRTMQNTVLKVQQQEQQITENT